MRQPAVPQVRAIIKTANVAHVQVTRVVRDVVVDTTHVEHGAHRMFVADALYRAGVGVEWGHDNRGRVTGQWS